MVRSRSTKRLALLIAILFLSISAWSFWKAYAAARTWTGASLSNPNPALRNNLWSNQFNWSGNVPPQPGDDLVFGAAPQPSQNDFPSGTTFNSISVGSGHIMTGNAVALNDGVTVTGGQVFLASITLNETQPFTAPLANAGANITSAIALNDKSINFHGPGAFLMGGTISGSGPLLRLDSGVTILTANNSYTGQTQVNGGTLIVNGSQPQSRVVAQTGGTLGGGGTIGRLTVQSIASVSSMPSKISPGNTNNGTAVLNAGTVLTINNGLSTVFEYDLKSETVGTGYDQLNVSGSVNLGDEPSTLQINLNFLPSPGTSFTIINNDGSEPVVSNFAGLPEGGTLTVNGITLVISYKGGDGNDVVLRVPQTKVWDGGGTTNNWSDAANWVGDVAPGFGDSLEFPSGAARLSSSNNFVPGTVFNSITFSGGGYNINGNGIALNAGINATVVSGIANVINAPIRLARSQYFITSGSSTGLQINSVNLEDKTLTMDGFGFCAIVGVISGTGSVAEAGTGESALQGANTYTGVTTIDTGRLDINGSQPNSAVNVFNGVLKGGGTIGPLVAFGGKVSPGPQALTVSGNVTLHESTTLETNTFVFGTPLLARLNVNGSVTITNSSLLVPPAAAVPTAPTSVIVSNDGSDPIIGTFASLAEGAIITAGTNQFRISYVGGDGNDVVLVRVPVTRRWDGGSAVNNNWTTKENWEGDVAPLAGDNLEFPAGAARLTAFNDFPVGTIFQSITLSGADYILGGNGISLTGGVSETTMSGAENFISLPITLNASQTFVTAGPTGRFLRFNQPVSLGDKSLTLDGTGPCNIFGAISGSGSITRRGTGLSVLSNTNTYTGSTVVESGTLRVDGNQPSSAVSVANGTLEGGGTVGPLVATGGKVSPSLAANSMLPLTVAGNVTLNQAATFEIRRFTPNSIRVLAGLKVNGAVNLGGSALTVVQSNSVPTNTTSAIIDNDGTDPVNGTFAGLAEGAIITSGLHQFQLSYVGGDGNDVTLRFLGNVPPTLQFSTTNFSVAENAIQATLNVFRTGDASSSVTVDFRTADTDNFTVGCSDSINNQGAAFGRCDFSTAVGTLTFAPNETQKQIHVSIIDDVIVEGNETFQVVLENPVGATIGTISTATVTINSNDVGGAPNPIFQSPFFVRQHYLDFLSREPEEDGFNAWLRVLNGCPDVNNLDPNSPSAQCDRIIVSQSFFGSEEFRIKGFYVFRFYKLAFNRLPEYLEIITDMTFIAGATPQEVFDRKAQLVNRFMQRQEFQTTYGSLSNADFVNALMSRYQLTQITTPDPQQPNGNQKVTFTATDLTNRLNAATLNRAQVFRAIADSDQVGAAEFNNAFVGMQYYGYLRRKPEPAGFNDWLRVVQSGDIRLMINGFMNSQEYRLRFGPP